MGPAGSTAASVGCRVPFWLSIFCVRLRIANIGRVFSVPVPKKIRVRNTPGLPLGYRQGVMSEVRIQKGQVFRARTGRKIGEIFRIIYAVFNSIINAPFFFNRAIPSSDEVAGPQSPA